MTILRYKTPLSSDNEANDLLALDLVESDFVESDLTESDLTESSGLDNSESSGMKMLTTSTSGWDWTKVSVMEAFIRNSMGAMI